MSCSYSRMGEIGRWATQGRKALVSSGPSSCAECCDKRVASGSVGVGADNMGAPPTGASRTWLAV